MLQNTLGRTGRTVSTVGLGTWQLGADWGDVDEEAALDVLRASADAASPSSTPPTCTATAAASRSSVGSCGRTRLPS